MTEKSPEVARARSDVARDWIGLALASFILLLPLSRLFVVFVDVRPNTRVEPLISAVRISPLDLAMVAVVVTLIVWRARTPIARLGGLIEWGAVGAIGIVLVASIAAIDALSISFAVRIVGVAAVIVAFRVVSDLGYRLFVVIPLIIGVVSQSVIAVFQVLTDSGTTAVATLEAEGRAWTAGQGTFQGPYTMAAFVIIAIAVVLESERRGVKRTWVLGATALGSIAVATTYGRSAALALATVAGVYGLRWIVMRSSRDLINALVIGVPFAVAALILNSAWLVRVAHSVAGNTLGREHFTEIALDVIRSNPWLGIGPGQYAHAIPSSEIWVVHNVPLLVAAEMGLLAALAFAAFLIAIGWRTITRSWEGSAIFLALLPFLVFDNLSYVFITGLGITAVWLGSLNRIVFADRDEPAQAPTPDATTV